MQITGNGILIGILSVIDSVKIVQLRLLHHRKLCIQILLQLRFRQLCYGHRNPLYRCHAVTGERHDQITGKLLAEAIDRCAVSGNRNRRIICGDGDFLVIKYKFILLIFNPGISRKLKIALAVRKICHFLRNTVCNAVCRIICIQKRQQLLLCQNRLWLSLHQYLKGLRDGFKIFDLFQPAVQYDPVRFKGRCQRYLRILYRSCHHTCHRINHRINGRLLKPDDRFI